MRVWGSRVQVLTPSPPPHHTSLPHQIRPEMISRVLGRKPSDWLAGMQPPTGLHQKPEAVFAPLPLYHCKSSASILLERGDVDICVCCKLIGGRRCQGPPASLNLLHQSAALAGSDLLPPTACREMIGSGCMEGSVAATLVLRFDEINITHGMSRTLFSACYIV